MKNHYKFNTGKGMIVEFEDIDSMASKAVIPSLWVAGGSESWPDVSCHLDMGTLAIENIKSEDVTLWGAGMAGTSGQFGFTSSIFKDGSALYIVVDEMLANVVGPGMATVGVYTYNQRSKKIDVVPISLEEFKAPEAGARDKYVTPEYLDQVTGNTRQLLDSLTEAFAIVVPLAKFMKDGADAVHEVKVPTNADLQKLFDLN